MEQIILLQAKPFTFWMTDRFVDGDVSNNQLQQGGDYPTFNLPLLSADGQSANVGYMGGDFQGVLEHADYIRDMGFTSVWLTPIVDNPDEAFAGGEANRVWWEVSRWWQNRLPRVLGK